TAAAVRSRRQRALSDDSSKDQTICQQKSSHSAILRAAYGWLSPRRTSRIGFEMTTAATSTPVPPPRTTRVVTGNRALNRARVGVFAGLGAYLAWGFIP